jgi:hypothetical protein
MWKKLISFFLTALLVGAPVPSPLRAQGCAVPTQGGVVKTTSLNGVNASIGVPPRTGSGFSVWTDAKDYFTTSFQATFYGIGGGTAQAQTATITNGPGSLATGMFFSYLPSVANTGGGAMLTLSNGVVTLPATYIVRGDTTNSGATLPVQAGDIMPGAVAYLIYTGTSFQLLNPQGDFTPPGASPYFDIRQYGGYVANFTPHAKTTARSKAVTLDQAYPGPKGGGIVIYGAGPAALTVTAPAAPTVNSGHAMDDLKPDEPMVVDNTGSNKDCYTVFAVDKNGGFSPASTPTCQVASLALGKQNVTISSKSLAAGSNVMTITCSTPCGAPAGPSGTGTRVHASNGTNAALSGYYHVYSGTSGATTITVNTHLYAPTSGAITDTGGSLVSWNVNQVREARAVANLDHYVVCEKRQGESAYAILGLMHPYSARNNDPASLVLTDFGNFGGAQNAQAPTLPSYYTAAACTATTPTAGMLATTVTAGAGTVDITTATAAGTSGYNLARLDNGPALAAACAAASGLYNGAAYIPVGAGYYVYSKQTLTGCARLIIAGTLDSAETLTFGGAIEGVASTQQLQFSYEGNSNLSCTPFGCGFPMLWSKSGGGPLWQHFTLNAGANGLGVLQDSQLSTSYVNCNTGASTDFIGQCFFVDPGYAFNTTYENGAFTGGPGNGPSAGVDASWGTIFEFAPQNTNVITHFRHMAISPRGVSIWNNGWGVSMDFLDVYDQGAINPTVSILNSSPGLNIWALNDTSPVPLYEVWMCNGGGSSNGVTSNGIYTTSREAHGFPYPFSGDACAVPNPHTVGVPVPLGTANVPQPYYRIKNAASGFSNGYGLSILPNPAMTANRIITWPDGTGTVALNSTANTFTALQTLTTEATATNCASSASPAACGSAIAGMFMIATSATSVAVNTTAVTATSEVILTQDASLGTALGGVTCTASTQQPYVSARVPGTSFTVAVASGLSGNLCLSYRIVN